MHDSSRPTDSQLQPTAWELAGRTDPPAPFPQPAVATEPTAFRNRTPGRASAIRAGIVLGSALVLAVGTAVVMGASPSAPAASPGTGAQPSAAPSVAPNHEGNGKRGAFGGFGPFGLFPFGIGPGSGAGPTVPGFGNGPSARFGGVGFGHVTVTAISGNDISLKTDDGWTRTITVTADTKVTKGGQAATLADVKVGDPVRFAEQKNADGTWTITALAVILPQTAGTVTAVGPDSITITGRDGTSQTIHTNAGTTYHRGDAGGSRSDVKVGSTVVATGERGSDGSLTATSVTVLPARVVGTVSAVSGDRVTITRRDGTTLTVHVSSATTIRVPGVAQPTISDVEPGMPIVVEGSQRPDGSLDATAIRAGGRGPAGPHDKNGPGAAPNASASPSATTG